MEILPTSDVNFQALADNIVADFFNRDIPLADGCIKVAKEQELNSSEVERLVEKTNTTASVHLLKTSEDKKATFTLANKELVLQSTHPKLKRPIEKQAAYFGIPNTKNVKPLYKLAAAKPAPKPQTFTDKYTCDQAIFKLRKSIDEAKLKKTAMELDVQDKIDYLASEFSKYNGPDFTKFAHESYALFGDNCLPVLEGMAKYLNVGVEKVAEIDFVVDDTQPTIKSMGDICSGLVGIVKKAQEISALENVLSFYNSTWREYYANN